MSKVVIPSQFRSVLSEDLPSSNRQTTHRVVIPSQFRSVLSSRAGRPGATVPAPSRNPFSIQVSSLHPFTIIENVSPRVS